MYAACYALLIFLYTIQQHESIKFTIVSKVKIESLIINWTQESGMSQKSWELNHFRLEPKSVSRIAYEHRYALPIMGTSTDWFWITFHNSNC